MNNHAITDAINAITTCVAELEETPRDATTIDPEVFKRRESTIAALSFVYTKMTSSAQRLAVLLCNLRSAHLADAEIMGELINAPSGWRSRRKRSCEPTQLTVHDKDTHSATHSTIHITDALTIAAIPVSTFDQVQPTGELYYVTTANHFAVMIAGQLIHGNIGDVFVGGENLEKIKDCHFASGCSRAASCNYYHNPMKYPGSRDVRNHIAGSWIYNPNGTRGRCRRFGSRARLDVDIAATSADDIERLHDQVMHDLLCYLVLCNATSAQTPEHKK